MCNVKSCVCLDVYVQHHLPLNSLAILAGWCISMLMVLCLITVICYDGAVNCGLTEEEGMWKQGWC